MDLSTIYLKHTGGGSHYDSYSWPGGTDEIDLVSVRQDYLRSIELPVTISSCYYGSVSDIGAQLSTRGFIFLKREDWTTDSLVSLTESLKSVESVVHHEGSPTFQSFSSSGDPIYGGNQRVQLILHEKFASRSSLEKLTGMLEFTHEFASKYSRSSRILTGMINVPPTDSRILPMSQMPHCDMVVSKKSFSDGHAVGITSAAETYLHVWPRSHLLLHSSYCSNGSVSDVPERVLLRWGSGDLLLMHPNLVHAGYLRGTPRVHFYLFPTDAPHLSTKSINTIANNTVMLSSFGCPLVDSICFE